MEQSLLYNLLSFGIIDKWRKAEEAENARFKKREQELAEQLKEELTEKGKDLIHDTVCFGIENVYPQKSHRNAGYDHGKIVQQSEKTNPLDFFMQKKGENIGEYQIHGNGNNRI